jgi:hypothetical protein
VQQELITIPDHMGLPRFVTAGARVVHVVQLHGFRVVMSVSTTISCVRNLLFISFEFISVHVYCYTTLFPYRMMFGSLSSYTTDSSSASELRPVFFCGAGTASRFFPWGSCCSIFSCLYCAMLIIVHSVVLFLLATVLSVFLRITTLVSASFS